MRFGGELGLLMSWSACAGGGDDPTSGGCEEAPLPVPDCEEAPLPVPEVCNGDEGFRLWGALGGGATEETTAFLQPWGYSGLYVNGACQWYAVQVDQATGPYTPVRTGAFTPQQMEQIASEFSLGQWGRLATPQASGPMFDVPAVILQAAGDQFTRIGDLGGLAPVWEQVRDQAATSWPTGQDARGENQAVRVLVWPADEGSWYPTTWDAGEWSGPPLAELAVPLSDSTGVRVYPEDGADLFRALREQLIAEGWKTGSWDYAIPLVQDEGRSWYVLVREELDMPQLFGAVAP
jgi:hypothetical protein